METALLKNGKEEARPVVIAVMMSLKSLSEDMAGWTVIYDLTMRCRDRNYKFFGDNEQKLKDLALVDGAGNIHESIRNVVLSAMIGEGLNMRLISPIKEDCPELQED